VGKNIHENRLRRMEACKRVINLGISALSMAFVVSIFWYHWMKYFKPSLEIVTNQKYYYRISMLEIAIYAIVLFLFFNMYGGTRLGYLKNTEIIFSQIFATALADLFIYGELSIMAHMLFINTRSFVEMFIGQSIALILYTNVANYFYRRIFPPRKLLMIHGDRPTEGICAKFESRKDKYVITEKMLISKDMQVNFRAIDEMYGNGICNAIVLWDIPTMARNKLLKYCYARSIRVYLMPKITDVILVGAEELHVFDSPMLLTREYNMTVEQRFIKRTIDIVFSLIMIILTSPFMLITALLVKITDGGPVLYKQVRCTRGRRKFEILKFRSMRPDAEKDGKPRMATKHDDRITPVGRVIRKCRIDELPQLFNILKGDMSFIGPRPERPEVIEKYLEVMPEFAFRMKVKAGLAGYAQVYGKYNTTPYDKLKLDLTYIENYSVWLDFKLMLLTLKVLLSPDAAEGVDEEQVSALLMEKQAQKKREDESAGGKV